MGDLTTKITVLGVEHGVRVCTHALFTIPLMVTTFSTEFRNGEAREISLAFYNEKFRRNFSILLE